jgi:acetolactate synthase-1/2/3 large subunit
VITAAEAMAAQLESYGVRYVFGTCGHTNIALLDALSRSQVRFVIARHEQAAAHAADGYARVSGQPGVLLLHVGPGMMNAVTGVATAALDSVPLVAISGDVPSYYAGRHPHQEVNLHADADQTAIYRPFTKRAWHVHRGPGPLHRARVLDRRLGPPGRRAAQRADGRLLPPGRGGYRHPLPTAR